MRVKVVVNRKAVRSYLRGGGRVLEACEDSGRRILEAGPPGCAMETTIGRNRVRVAIWTDTREAMKAEATDRALSRALDAGR